jgi:N-acetylated-alpha-linked acidic dipeptidase
MSDAMIDRLTAAVSAQAMWRHLEEFAKRVKLSGTPEELESFRYLQACLEGYGLKTDLILHDAYISLPGKARLEVGNQTPDCITHSFSRASPTGGLRGKLAYAGAGGEKDFAALDVRGKIVLLEHIANPAASLRASEAGAIGQIHISPHQHLHEMCISPVWGSPTDATLGKLPKTVVLSVRQADGEALKRRVQAGEEVEAALYAEVDTRWRKTPILVAELFRNGAADDEPFVMFSGHHDTWHLGVMDNGGANATMLEVARLIAPERDKLRRGLRLCFWSGHSHGRYSGSTWYADTHWEDLARRCAIHVNVDSTGAKGNTVMTDALSSSELFGLASEAVQRQGGQTLDGHRMSRAGDQSFWGIGIPSIFMGMGEQPLGSDDNVMGAILGGSNRKAAGFGWWWHTPDDTLDKMDPDLLVRDTRVYVHTLWRVLTDRVLPLDYAAHAEALCRELEGLAAKLDGRLDLAPLARRAKAFREHASTLKQRAAGASSDAEAARINAKLMAASRAMVPMDYTSGNRFEPDPALGQSVYPVLDPLRHLAETSADGDAAKFATVAARRAANRLAHALDEANACMAG